MKTIEERVIAVAEKLAQKEAAKTKSAEKYAKLEKVKKLTTDQRLARIEEMLGIV